jgi:hypothetical protein
MGHILSVGASYTYVFKYVDPLGNTRTVMGYPFVIDALLHKEEKGLVISLSSKKLFGSHDRVELKKSSLPLIKETADYIKDHFGSPLLIEAYNKDKNKAKRQGEKIASLLAKELIIPQTQIKILPIEGKEGEYRIDVILVNP